MKINVQLLSFLKYIENLNPLFTLIATIVFGSLRFVIPKSLIPEVGQLPFRKILLGFFVFFLILFFWNLINWIQVNKTQKREKEKADQEKNKLEAIRKQWEITAEIELKFKGLHPNSKIILKDFLEDSNKPKQFWVDDEDVQQLESKGIIEKISPVTIGSANIKTYSYKIKSWAWDYLQNDQHLINFSINDLQNMV